MSQYKKVSVIVPIYNTPVEFLRTCIKSISSQTYKNLEVLLIDDGSKEEIAHECDDLKITYESLVGNMQVIHKHNSGVSSARNCGIEIAQGEYIVFIDSDDFVHPDFIKVLVATIEEWDCEMAVCNLKNYYGLDDLKEEEQIEDNTRKTEMLIGADIYKRTKGYIWNRIYRRTAIGDIRFNKQFYFGEDGLFLEDIITKVGRCAYVNQVLYYYRINGFGTSTNMSSNKYLQAIYMGNKQLENPYIKADKELLSKRISVRELYRIKYMVALEAEKPNNYLELLRTEKQQLNNNIKETWATDSKLLKISQNILKLPFPVGRIYLKFLRMLQGKKQLIKKQQWKNTVGKKK